MPQPIQIENSIDNLYGIVYVMVMLTNRHVEPILKRLAAQYPVVTLTGPRQSGKTTLCKMAFKNYDYLSLENPDVRRQAESDPRTLLASFSRGIVLDEVQRAPELLSYIQGIVDEHDRSGMFILTGSAQFELLHSVSQSLAGRTALLRLLPFSFAEAYPGVRKPVMNEMLFKGFYPRIFDKKLAPTEALAYYCATYVERDVRSLLNIRDLSSFDRFLRMCAGRTGQLLNASALGNDCAVTHATAASWLSILEASYIVFLLRPHFRNFNKRLVKSPKIYFTDCGLAAYLLSITSPEQLATHPLFGSLFETFVVSELVKQRYHSNQDSNLYFWRDNAGHEIDIILDFGQAVLPVEVKAGRTVTADYFRNIDYYRTLNPDARKAAIVYGGNRTFAENDTWVISYRDIAVLANLDYRLELAI